MSRGQKIKNEYVSVLGDLYKDTTKAVFAALAVSYIVRLEGEQSGSAFTKTGLSRKNHHRGSRADSHQND